MVIAQRKCKADKVQEELKRLSCLMTDKALQIPLNVSGAASIGIAKGARVSSVVLSIGARCINILLASILTLGTVIPARAAAPTFTLPADASKSSVAQKESAKTASQPAAAAKKKKQAKKKKARKVKRNKVKQAGIRRPVMHAHAGRGTGVQKVMFTPATRSRPLSQGHIFGLHKTPDAMALRSAAAYVIDQNTNELLVDKNSRTVLPIASISKLMTAMVVLDTNPSLTDMLEVKNADRDFEKGTHSRLSVGSRLSRADMLHIALMSSENRAASSLANYYPGGKQACVEAMNAKARDLGMYDTHFVDPTGLTSRNVSSARDLAKMVNMAYQYRLIREYSTDVSHNVFTGHKVLHYKNSNALVRNIAWPIGLQKTGFINEAGECLVMQATVGDRPLIIVLLDSTGKSSRFTDALRIRAWVTKQNMYAKTHPSAPSTPTIASQN